MKKILKISLLAVVCTLMLGCLVGCSRMFDALNFNRQPLPNPGSVPEEGLTNKYSREENSITKSELETLITDSFKDRDEFVDSLSISFSSSEMNMVKYEMGYQSEFTVVEKQVNKPYASFKENISDNMGGYFADSIYFYDGFFASDGNQMYNMRFMIDEDIDIIPFAAYETLQSGGLLVKLCSKLSDNFKSSYKDYVNGSEALMVALKDEGKEIVDILPQRYLAEDFSGSLNSISSVELQLLDGKVVGISLSAFFDGGKMTIDCRTDEVKHGIEFNSTAYLQAPSFMYHMQKLIYGSSDNVIYSNDAGKEVKANVKVGTAKYEGVPSEFTFINAGFNEYNWTRYVKVFDLGNKKVYYRDGSFYVEENGSIRYEENYSEYGNLLNMIQFFFGADSYLSTDCVYDLDATTDGYKITITQTFIDYDYEKQEEIYIYNTRTYLVNKDFNKMLSYKRVFIEDGVTEGDIEVEFIYEYEYSVPSQIFGEREIKDR